jgi:yecA family protein
MQELHAATLRAFVEGPNRPPDTLTYHELQGFLFTVACSPELVMPSEWMPVVFGDRSPEYASLDEAREVTSALMGLYNEVNAAVFEQRAALPEDCRFREPPLANLEEDAPIAQWSRGFLRGHNWLEESWEYVPKQFDEEFGSVLMTLSFFASRKLAEGFAAETKNRDVSAMATTLAEVFPEAVLRPLDSAGARGSRRQGAIAIAVPEGWPQRALPVRQRKEVQEVLRRRGVGDGRESAAMPGGPMAPRCLLVARRYFR